MGAELRAATQISLYYLPTLSLLHGTELSFFVFCRGGQN